MNQLNNGRETWGTRIGVILAVTGSAVGLGNFLRFPGLAAEYGGGAFMIPYAVAFLLLGLPIAWVEWTMGRYGGRLGYNSTPGIFRAICGNNRVGSYLGALGPLIPVMVYMYYVFIEAWCLGYAWNYLTGGLNLGADPDKYDTFFGDFVGAGENGFLLSSGGEVVIFLLICFALNFLLIYRGLTKGIEWFCKWAMPALVVCALIVLVRVLTLGTPDASKPDQSLANGLGYMWNPVHQAENLAPGDDAVKRLLVHSTGDSATPVERDGVLASLTIDDAAGVKWALQQSGWKPAATAAAPDAADTPTDGAPPAIELGDWEHAGSKWTVEVRAAEVVIIGPKDQRPSLTEPDKHVAALLKMLPHKVASVTKGEAGRRFDTFDVLDRDGFVAAMAATDWSVSADDAGVYRHRDSRLKIALGEGEAVIRAPQFVEMLSNPEIWLAAAGQIFFSLSVGFGIIITYASYMKKDDDVALSSLTAAAGNGWCEVALGGLITIPAAFVFLGVSTVTNPPGTFGMGFVSLPNVFNQMPAGQLFGFLFFFLLFLAAVTSSLSMLQPAIALLEEGLGLGRKASVALLGFITAVGSGYVVYFSKGFVALDTVDFWVGTFCIYVMATVQVILFAWVLGVKRGMEELNRGSEVRVPAFVAIIIKYVAPVYLLFIFGMWVWQNAPGRIDAIINPPEGETPIVAMSVGLIGLVLVFFLFVIARSNARWDRFGPPDPMTSGVPAPKPAPVGAASAQRDARDADEGDEEVTS